MRWDPEQYLQFAAERGRPFHDLLPSAGCQVVLQDLLDLDRVSYAHVPLVLGSDGRRLAKRHGAVAIAELRESGVPAERVVGRLGQTLAIETGGAATADDLVGEFAFDRIPRDPVALDLRW